MFQALQEQAPDILLQLIKLHKADPRPDKIDVGVGVYRDQLGTTPVFGAVKIAEAQLLEQQSSKSYLGADGDIGFVERLAPIVFGERRAISDGLWGLQTPGGTGALRLAADLIARANPEATIWLWTPTWPNHRILHARLGSDRKCIVKREGGRCALDSGGMPQPHWS
jgi:aromatic-amino-acid transaminase